MFEMLHCKTPNLFDASKPETRNPATPKAWEIERAHWLWYNDARREALSCGTLRVPERAGSNVNIPAEEIADFCRRWRVTELALFGSALRHDFRPDSDVDVLVTFAPDAPWSLLDIVKMQDELKEIFGREVDLVEKEGLRNPFRRHSILTTRRIIYAA